LPRAGRELHKRLQPIFPDRSGPQFLLRWACRKLHRQGAGAPTTTITQKLDVKETAEQAVTIDADIPLTTQRLPAISSQICRTMKMIL